MRRSSCVLIFLNTWNQSTKKILAISQLSEDLDLNYQQSVIELNEVDQELAEIRPDHETIMMRAGKLNLETSMPRLMNIVITYCSKQCHSSSSYTS